jgi:SPP1 family predicted phage head-tail adaptor
MRAGKLRHRVTFQRYAAGQGASGQPTRDWQTVRTVWAEVTPITGRERVVAAAEVAELDTKIRIRYTPEFEPMTAKWRAVYRGVFYDIKSVANVNMADREIELFAQSGVNVG